MQDWLTPSGLALEPWDTVPIRANLARGGSFSLDRRKIRRANKVRPWSNNQSSGDSRALRWSRQYSAHFLRYLGGMTLQSGNQKSRPNTCVLVASRKSAQRAPIQLSVSDIRSGSNLEAVELLNLESIMKAQESLSTCTSSMTA